MNANTTIIEKELLATMHFPKTEVLTDPKIIKDRIFQAKRAMLIGNYLKNKVKIVFEDSVGRKMVETTVWGLTDQYLLLKGAMSLPIHRIYEIIIY